MHMSPVFSNCQSKMTQPPPYSQVSKETNPPQYAQTTQKTNPQPCKRGALKNSLCKLGKGVRDGFFGTTDPILHPKP